MNNNFKMLSHPKYDNYLDCIVAFIDILGFDARARNIQSEYDFNNVASLLFTLKETAIYFDTQNALLRNLNATAISDSVIFTMPFQDPTASAMSLTVILHWLQYELLQKYETLIRGYMTRGPVYHKDNIIFGKGYSEAFRKESEIGHAPRIIIDPSFIDEAKVAIRNAEFVDHIFNYIIQDSCDGYYFIDYLRPVGLQASIEKEQLIVKMDKIKKFVFSNLITYKNDNKILRKYKWLNNYISLSDHYFE